MVESVPVTGKTEAMAVVYQSMRQKQLDAEQRIKNLQCPPLQYVARRRCGVA
jgi:hypothetical protein